MRSTRENGLSPAAAILFALALCAAWGAGLGADTASGAIRLGLLLVASAAGIVAVTMLYRTRGRERRALLSYVDALCTSDPLRLDEDSLPSPPAGSDWRDLADRLLKAFGQLFERLQEAEHARTALELRCRRSATETRNIQTILAGLEDPILAINDYDELVLANSSAEQLFDLDSTDPEKRVLNQVVACEKLVDLLSAAGHRDVPTHRTEEIELTDDHGRSHWYRVTAAPLRQAAEDGAGEAAFQGSVAVLRDIESEKALGKRNAEFVSAVSHEMKTPLAGIKAYVELLIDGDAEDEETREEFLGVIDSQADRLQRLVENLLNIARIEAGVVEVNKDPRSLNKVLEEAFGVVQPAAGAKNIELNSELSPMHLRVLADHDLLLQAAINLLSNAVKYTPEGGRVVLRSRMMGSEIAFEVEDTGVGLSEEDAGRVFEKFYRVKKDRNSAPGTGLGLPLAKHIVEDVHGGRLTVRSVPERGSTFTVTLPGAAQLAGASIE
ncbi:MAG: hypothetical protein HQ581_16995 [Planctomycetes bacterium]|nr:hypothetical protein [Planctomycetota bacterium]